jgi:hypothetical protein
MKIHEILTFQSSLTTNTHPNTIEVRWPEKTAGVGLMVRRTASFFLVPSSRDCFFFIKKKDNHT